MEFRPVAKPQTESELVVMVGLLEAHGIPHFVHNRGFGGLYPGMQMELYNVRSIMVAESHVGEATELLSVFSKPSAEATVEEKLTIWDRLRVIVETLLFSWSFPRKRQKNLKESDEGI